MKTETIDQFLIRGGEIKKIYDTSAAYKKYKSYGGKFKSYTKNENAKNKKGNS